MNEFAKYRPCAGHSLNLVGVTAASCCEPAVSYFGFVNRLYTFFAASTHRSAVLVTSLPPRTSIVKRLADTRWAAHSVAIKSLSWLWGHIEALDILTSDSSQTSATRNDAQNLVKKMDKLETVLLTQYWNDTLSRFYEVSKTIQKADVNLAFVVNLLQSLKEYTRIWRVWT